MCIRDSDGTSHIRECIPVAIARKADHARAVRPHEPIVADPPDGGNPVVPQARIESGIAGAHHAAFQHRKAAESAGQQAIVVLCQRVHMPVSYTHLSAAITF